MDDLDKKADLIYRKTKHFKQYEGMSEEQIRDIIKANLLNKEDEGLLGTTVKKEAVDDLGLDMLFPEGDDKKNSRTLARKYLSDFTIETISDKNTLVQIIYLEVIQGRLQAIINKMYADKDVLPLQMLDSLHKNLTEITNLKTQLGISRQKLEGDKKSAVDLLDLLKKKFQRYREQNQLSRNMVCPHCGQMCLLKIRTDKYDIAAHPFFKDRILCNPHLIKLYKAGKLTQDDVSNVLGCSPDYVRWLTDNWEKRTKKQTEEDEQEQHDIDFPPSLPTEDKESGVE